MEQQTGKRFGDNFRTDGPPPPVVTALKGGSFAASRVTHAGGAPLRSEIPAQPAFVLAYVLSQGMANSQVWIGGRPAKVGAIKPGNIRFYDLEPGITAHIHDPLDFVSMYLPFESLDAFTEEHGLPKITGCTLKTGAAFADPIVAQLANSLIPALSYDMHADQLQLDQTAFTLQSHFAYRYAGLQSKHALYRGGLTPKQERRVKELMLADIRESVSVQQLAQECDLSRSQFFRAFRMTTGKTPHRWMMQSRVEVSKQFLLHSNLSLAEIAERCGFANPSHFTRAFYEFAGQTPKAWRTTRLG